MPLFFDKVLNAWYIEHNGEKIITSNHDLEIMKELEINKEDQSGEESHLYNIISACELVLDDMEHGAKLSESSFNLLGYADGIMLRVQKDVGKQSDPTNIK